MSNSKKKWQKPVLNSTLTTEQISEIEARFKANDKLLEVARSMKVSLPAVRYRFEMLAKARKEQRVRLYNIILRRPPPTLNCTQHGLDLTDS